MRIALPLCFVTLAACTLAPELAAGPLPPDLGRPDALLENRNQDLDLKGALAKAAEGLEQREKAGALDQALALLRLQWRTHPDDPALNLALAEAHSRACEVLDITQPGDRDPHARHRSAGLFHADAALKALPEEGRIRYWRGALLLHIADAERSYNRMKEALSELLRAERKVPALDAGGPARLIGRIFQETPGFPFLGSKPKAVEWYGKALDQAPDFIQNQLWLGETHQQLKEVEKARHHLDQAASLPLRKGHEREDGRYREQARALLLKL